MIKRYHLFLNFKLANIFNKLFTSQCIPLDNDCKIPDCQRYVADAKVPSIGLKIVILT